MNARFAWLPTTSLTGFSERFLCMQLSTMIYCILYLRRGLSVRDTLYIIQRLQFSKALSQNFDLSGRNINHPGLVLRIRSFFHASLEWVPTSKFEPHVSFI